jgi:hypothetical protein
MACRLQHFVRPGISNCRRRFPTRLGRIGSWSTLLSNDEMEASERVRAMGKLAIYAPKAVVECGGWRAGILDFIDRYRLDVIHVNHAFEMLLAVRIRELVFRRTGRIPRVICDTHDVQAKAYAKRSAENPFNKQQDRYSELLESELSLYRQANALIHCSNDDKKFFEQKLPLILHQLVIPCLNPRHEKALTQIRGHAYGSHFDFVYVGNNNFVNFIAVKWLLTEVFPLLNEPPPRIAFVGAYKRTCASNGSTVTRKAQTLFCGKRSRRRHLLFRFNRSPSTFACRNGMFLKIHIEALCAGKTVIATADSLRGLPDHVKERCAEFVRDTPRQFTEAIMMTLARPLGDNHKAASIYDDHFHSKHYITGMNDLFAEILQSRENDTCGQSMR